MQLASRPCSTPGCPLLASDGSRCKLHQRVSAEQYDRQRGKTTERGYDKDHIKLRVARFERDGWRCVDCGWEPDVIQQCREAGLDAPPTAVVLEELRCRFARHERHLHADHEIPIEVQPDLRLELDNLRTRCNTCHAAKTRRERSGAGYPK
jgi:5-methylcytosine-specific restriction enzyme A